jgi:hypothetical protein
MLRQDFGGDKTNIIARAPIVILSGSLIPHGEAKSNWVGEPTCFTIVEVTPAEIV